MSTGALSHEDLRTLFLFEQLSEEQLDWIVEHAVVEEFAAGSTVLREGLPGRGMPAFSLGDQESRDLVAYLRTLRPPPRRGERASTP